MKRIFLFVVVIVGALLLAACSTAPWRNFAPGPMTGSWQGWQEYESNGEQIYFTATNENGERIRYTGGPSFGGMMGSYLTCASCHGADGRGGIHTMHMDVMDAPDIRYPALSAETDEHGEEEDAHADEHGEYDLEAFRSAVVSGQHPDGEALSRDMPRWRISDDDLEDLFEFIKSLP